MKTTPTPVTETPNVYKPATREINLVDGVFDTKEAFEMLKNLYTSKIEFHQMKNFSHTERFGRPHSFSQTRIESLRISLQKITEAIREAEKNNQMLKIHANIQLTLVDQLQ